MLEKEFTDRTGFRPTSDCYHQCIEPEYNRSNLDKDDWCKKWKRNGGFQQAYDWQCKAGADAAAKAALMEHNFNAMTEDYNESVRNLKQAKKSISELTE